MTRLGHETGFSLLEGMLASVMLAIGLLTLSGMQSIAFVKSGDAHELTRATTLASDMLERIYFNRRNAASYHNIDTLNAATCAAIDTSTQPMARGDCLLWESLVSTSRLNTARGRITVDSVAPTELNQRRVVVTITWVGSARTDTNERRPRSVVLTRIVAPE